MFVFSIPDGRDIRFATRSLLIAMEQHPNWFYGDFQIDAVFGSPQGFIWNGYNYEPSANWDNEYVEELVGFYKTFGLFYRLDCTNFLLTPGNLADPYANMVATIVEANGGEAIVTSVLMYEYIKRRFPNLKICRGSSWNYGQSMEEGIHNINVLTKLERIVLPYDYNGRPGLEKLIHPEKVVLSVCERCVDNCLKRKEHDELICKANLGKCNGGQIENPNKCLLGNDRNDFIQQIHVVGRTILKGYKSIGIEHFQISGKGNIESVLAAYSYYFVLEEAREKFLDFVQSIYHNVMCARGVHKNGIYYSSFYSQEEYVKCLDYLYFNGGPVR